MIDIHSLEQCGDPKLSGNIFNIKHPVGTSTSGGSIESSGKNNRRKVQKKGAASAQKHQKKTVGGKDS